MANNGWHLWGEYHSGGGDIWTLVGLGILAWLIWANWDSV